MEIMDVQNIEKTEGEIHDCIDDFEIDEDASRCSNGITTYNSDEGLDIKIDLHV
jgi:hypothetical protein